MDCPCPSLYFRALYNFLLEYKMIKKTMVALIILAFAIGSIIKLPYNKFEKADLIRFEIHDSIVRLLEHFFPAYDKKSLLNKIDKGPKEWMDRQISQDIGNQKVTEAAIDTYLDSIPKDQRLHKYQMVKVIIDSDSVYTMPHRLPYFDGRRRSVIEALQRLQKLNLLKPCVFILSVADLMPPEYKGQVPIFTYSKNLADPFHKNLILIPDGMNLSRWGYIYKNINFANKAYDWLDKKNIIFWRGSNTNKIREKIVHMADKKSYMDVSIPTTKKEGYTIPEMQIPYKYLISLDGVSSTWPGLLWKLASNSLVIKQDSSHIQWYYQALKPNVHYLPVENDLSNLFDVYKYAVQNDVDMEKISRQAQSFVKDNVLYEDMLVYTKFLIDEYQSNVYQK